MGTKCLIGEHDQAILATDGVPLGESRLKLSSVPKQTGESQSSDVSDIGGNYFDESTFQSEFHTCCSARVGFNTHKQFCIRWKLHL